MSQFIKLVYTTAGLGNAALAIAACRAGGVGVLNAELKADSQGVIDGLRLISGQVRSGYGLKLDAIDELLAAEVREHSLKGLRWLILDAEMLASCGALVDDVRAAGVTVLAEVTTPHWPAQELHSQVDGLVLKGNEAGGFVGEDSSFILLQKWLKQTRLPLYVRGGLTPHVAAACSAVGVAGGVFDSQLLLLDEAQLPESLRTSLGNLAGSETVAVGDGENGEYFRVLVRPGHTAARTFVSAGEGRRHDELKHLVHGKVDWRQPAQGLLPVGHDVCFAAPWRKQYRHIAALFKAIDAAVEGHLRIAAQAKAIHEHAPLAKSLGMRFPIVQGPMTRVSDSAEFAQAVAEGGALPMVAFALLKGAALEKLLAQTKKLLGDRPWGIGLLGFAPQALLDEQLAIATAFKPDYAIIAGGRPDQAVHLEQSGVPTFLHVPSANLIPMFLQEGARRFIFEGRECGGHIGPLSSFVLWSSMVDRLVAELALGKVKGEEIELLFAGGIHDAVSSAMVQVLVAPLVAKEAKVGILMGSAYLFTKEIVESGAIVPQFQQEVLDCEQTVNLESGPGHASRCAYTPFAREFFKKRVELRENKVPVDEGREVLDDLIMGRLRIASKGRMREGLNGHLQDLDADHQRREGMYMLGQVATLRAEVTGIDVLHAQVTEDAHALLVARLEDAEEIAPSPSRPVDIAIVGIASVLPKANTTREYWENILDKVDAITEIPSHRWDWRLYFDTDRHAPDKIYSKWGGFLDDMAFDPTRYGMPPKSIESVDPMQLMALEVAQRTIVDAGYHEKEFTRERASVIIGASGGTGDVGTQYGLRSELPRFSGALPESVANRLPEWTEDSFAGILVNVIAGRIANRLNFGGVNFTTDAACASSLAAVYQGVSELTAGRSDFVIAGGVDTVQGPFGYLCFSKTQALSPRGQCSTFDESGDGIVISEGIAMVALKRLEDAERDGDRIYAVIKGVGGSSDGNAKGMTAPLPAGQLRAMRRAYAQAGFGPRTVGLFEAHGTGTVAGDTAELESTTRLIKEEGGSARRSAIGSVKTMIGHTKATAGIAGLIKAALALHHRVLPPHRGVDRPNKILQHPDSPLYLIDEAQPWITTPDTPRRAAASAFGFGGTNFHVVMEEYTREYRDWLRPTAARRWPAELLLWSEPQRDALVARLADTQRDLADALDVPLRHIAASLAAQWQAGGETLAIVAKDTADLASKLGVAMAWFRGEIGALPPSIHHGGANALPGKLAVLFPGQGSQYPGMLREVALHFPACADTLAEADGVLRDAFDERFGDGMRLSHFILPRGCYGEDAKTEARQALTQTDVAQPALGAVETALLRLMKDFGLAPDMAAGHSYGEFVALHAGGAIGFDSMMSLSAARGRFIVDAAKAEGAELGTMAAVQAPRQHVEEAIADIDGVIIANHNAPTQSIISGSRVAVLAASAQLAKAGIEVTDIPVAAAFHSSLVKPAQKALADMIEAMPWRGGSVPVYSNTTARPHSNDVAKMKRQMADHLVCPVEFVSEIQAMYGDGARVFLEVGPKSVLTRLTTKILEGLPHVAIPLDDGSGLPGLLNAVGRLLCAGVDLDVSRLFKGRECVVGDPARLQSLRRNDTLPKYAWLLNGSGARRAGEPVKQIGVTLEEASRAAAAPAAAEQAPVAMPAAQPQQAQWSVPAQAASQSSPVIARQGISQRRWSKERQMDERRPAPLAGDAVMAEYFETMRQFLETQERVMTAFMGDASAPRSVGRFQRSAPSLALPRFADYAPPQVAAMPHPAAPIVVSQPAAPIEVPAPPVVHAPAQAVKPPSIHNGASAAVATTPHVNGVAKPKDDADGGGELGLEKLTDMLLKIVEEKTGYPRDMVGLDQSLESDLGIDSIKRIEVVGAMLQALPERYRQALSESRSKLNTQPTLNGMLSMLTAKQAGKATSVPFDLAEAGSVAALSHLPRHIVCAKPEAIDASALRQLTVGHFLVTEDRLGVAQELSRLLGDAGCAVTLVGRDVLADEPALIEWITQQRAIVDRLAGIVHLAQLGTDWLSSQAGVTEWRAQLQLSEKSLFLLVRDFGDKLVDEAHVLSASALGGHFNRLGSAAPGLCLQSGAVGMLKSLLEERPTWRAKAVDLDATQAPASLASSLFGELELAGGRQEVGYPQGQRTVFHTVEAPLPATAPHRDPPRNAVVLATGGARGITAEVLRELAVPGNTLVLTGRTPLPEPEGEALAALTGPEALRQHFITEVRSGVSQLKPADIQRKVQTILAAREMRGNIEDLRASGARVEYHAVDVTNEADVGKLLNQVYEKHGSIDGVVHGAGVIEDKLLADKASDSWSRVVETKVIGFLLLQKYLRPASLKFFTVFSSVAGRYGNSGQSDYATANELMNRLCCQLCELWENRVHVNALCWGPWGATKFGVGMVTAQTEAKFAEKGVFLVSAETGRRLFKDEISRGDQANVEIICGEGPWEQREAANGVIRRAAAPAAGPMIAPLLGSAVTTSLPMGDQIVTFSLDTNHAYLQQHCIDSTPILPAAAALELMAEAARSLWKGWKVVEVRDCRLIKGVDLKDGQRKLLIVVNPPPYGSSEGFEVNATLQSEQNGKKLIHYKCILRLEQQLQTGFAHEARAHSEKKLTVAKAYGEWLFHGPCFQVIEGIKGLSSGGASATVRPTRPAQWLRQVPAEHDQWVFDPALVDAAAQMAILWARAFRDETSLPTRFGRVVRYRETLPERMQMAFEHHPAPDPNIVRANVYYLDAAGEVVMLIEDMECIASAALNRLGGTAKAATETSASLL